MPPGPLLYREPLTKEQNFTLPEGFMLDSVTLW